MPHSCVVYLTIPLRKQWIHAIKRDNYTPTKHSRVCELHFLREEVERSIKFYSASGDVYEVPLRHPRLKPTDYDNNNKLLPKSLFHNLLAIMGTENSKPDDNKNRGPNYGQRVPPSVPPRRPNDTRQDPPAHIYNSISAPPPTYSSAPPTRMDYGPVVPPRPYVSQTGTRPNNPPAVPARGSASNTQPPSSGKEDFVVVESIPREKYGVPVYIKATSSGIVGDAPHNPVRSTTSNEIPSPAPHQFEQNQILDDNSDNESVISQVSSVGNYKGNYRGRGGRGRGQNRGGVRKNYQQNFKNKREFTPNQQHSAKTEFVQKKADTDDQTKQVSEGNNEADSSVNAITNTLKNTKLKQKNQQILNILLLGETGVGKSTFINSIVNYLSYDSFEQAEKDKLHILISSTFTAWDRDHKDHQITVKNETTETVADDNNEDLKVGNSATQQVKIYTFTIRNGEIRIRLIDTPGIGDTRGLEQDEINCQNVLDYISQLDKLHAICYLFKPDNSRKTPHFNYCVTSMLSRLEKSACNNLIFLFTHTRGSNYTSGETYSLLKELADEIGKQSPDVKISIDANKFCVDNEAFRHLAAVKQGVKFSNEVRVQNLKSWQKSSEVCTKLIDHILSLKPHMVNNTKSINECRRHLIQLSQPMAEITLLIEDNINQLDRHKAHLELYQSDRAELEDKLYIPILDVKVKRLFQPVTVCIKCAEPVRIGDFVKWHYPKKCCQNCHLRSVPNEIIGSPELTNCDKMAGFGQSCLTCGHHYKMHQHIYYDTEIIQSRQVDDNIKKSLENKEALIETAKKTLNNLETRKNALENELKKIMEFNAKFVYFLQKHALTPINDSYEEYIQHMITSEKNSGSSPETIASLEKLLKSHKAFKKLLFESKDVSGKSVKTVTPQDIQKSIQQLYGLPHFGDKIKDMYQKQTSSIKKEFSATEYIHREVFKRMPNENKEESIVKSNAEKGAKKKNRRKNKNNNETTQPTNDNNPKVNDDPQFNKDAFHAKNQGYQQNDGFQNRGHYNQFNKNRGQPNNRRGFQRGRGGARAQNPRSRSRGPGNSDREAPPSYDEAVNTDSFSHQPNQGGPQKQKFNNKNQGYHNQNWGAAKGARNAQASAKAGPTIQVNVTLAQPDQPQPEHHRPTGPPFTPREQPFYGEGRGGYHSSPSYHNQPSNSGYDSQGNYQSPPQSTNYHNPPPGHYPPNAYPNMPPQNHQSYAPKPGVAGHPNRPDYTNVPPRNYNYQYPPNGGNPPYHPDHNSQNCPPQQGRPQNYHPQGNQRGQGKTGRGAYYQKRGPKKNQNAQ